MFPVRSRGLAELIKATLQEHGGWMTAKQVHALIQLKIPPDSAYREGIAYQRCQVKKGKITQGARLDFDYLVQRGGYTLVLRRIQFIATQKCFERRKNKQGVWEYRYIAPPGEPGEANGTTLEAVGG